MSFRPFVVLAHIDQQQFLAGVHTALYIWNIGFLHALFCVLHKLQKLWRMRHRRLPFDKMIIRKSVAQPPEWVAAAREPESPPLRIFVRRRLLPPRRVPSSPNSSAAFPARDRPRPSFSLCLW